MSKMIANAFSEIKHDDLWEYYYLGDKAICPCCKKNEMTKHDHSTWERAHIIPKKGKQKVGPYIYENVRPICLNCNTADRSSPDNYAYMVKIGTMKAEERVTKLESLITICSQVITNPATFSGEAEKSQ